METVRSGIEPGTRVDPQDQFAPFVAIPSYKQRRDGGSAGLNIITYSYILLYITIEYILKVGYVSMYQSPGDLLQQTSMRP